MNCPLVMKMCSQCGEILHVSKYHKDKRKKYGVQNKCRVCVKEYNKAYQKKCKQQNKINITEKKCFCCGRTLSIDNFYKNSGKKDGCDSYCKECRKENDKEYRQRNKQRNKENITEKKCSCCGKILSINNFYKDSCNKDGYNNQCKECRKEIDKEYLQNPQGQAVKFNARNRRRMKEKQQGNGITTEQWYEMNSWFEWKCAYSGEPLNKSKDTYGRSIDHIVALKNGGEHEIWNLVPMRLGYNSSKNDNLDMEEWYRQQEYFSEERLQKIYEWQEYAWNKWGYSDKEDII